MSGNIYIYKVWDEGDDGYEEWYGELDELWDYITEYYPNNDHENDIGYYYDKLGLKIEEVWSNYG